MPDDIPAILQVRAGSYTLADYCGHGKYNRSCQAITHHSSSASNEGPPLVPYTGQARVLRTNPGCTGPISTKTIPSGRPSPVCPLRYPLVIGSLAGFLTKRKRFWRRLPVDSFSALVLYDRITPARRQCRGSGPDRTIVGSDWVINSVIIGTTRRPSIGGPVLEMADRVVRAPAPPGALIHHTARLGLDARPHYGVK